MDKFKERLANPINKQRFQEHLQDKIYKLIKENIYIDVDNDGDTNVILGGIEELTEKMYQLVQTENMKKEIEVLERFKVTMTGGPLSFKVLNERINYLEKSIKDGIFE